MKIATFLTTILLVPTTTTAVDGNNNSSGKGSLNNDNKKKRELISNNDIIVASTSKSSSQQQLNQDKVDEGENNNKEESKKSSLLKLTWQQSLDEFEDQLEYDLTDATNNNRELGSSWSSGDEWCYCENRRKNGNGGRDDDRYDDDDRFDDDDDLRCRDIEQRKRCNNASGCRWSNGSCRDNRRELDNLVEEGEEDLNEEFGMDEEMEMIEDGLLDNEKTRKLVYRRQEDELDNEIDNMEEDNEEEEDRELMSDSENKRQRMKRIRANNRGRFDDDRRRDDDDRLFGRDNGYTAGQRPGNWGWSSSTSSGDWWGGGFRPGMQFCRRFGRASRCENANCRWLSRFDECVARAGNGNYGFQPQCNQISGRKHCLRQDRCSWTCSSRPSWWANEATGLGNDEVLKQPEEKKTNSAAGNANTIMTTGMVYVGLASVTMLYTWF